MGATTGRRWRRATAGLSLVALSGAVAVVGLFGSTVAVAQEGDEQPVEIEGSALYVRPFTDAIPPTVTSSVPPEAVCVVEPRLCPGEIEPVRALARDTLNTVLDSTQDAPVQTVPPDSAAVSFFGGHDRYLTAIRFPAPSLPEGEEFLSWQISFEQTQPSYDLNSPMFRHIFFAVFATLGPQDPAILVEELVNALQKDPIVVDGNVIGIEACPLLSEFEQAGAPQAADYREMPTREEDGSDVPDIDCNLGSGGVFDESTGRWIFDLGFTANAWAEGEIENHGVLLRPTGAPNLAFGDPDTSTNAQVTLDLTTVTASGDTAEEFDPSDVPDIEPIGDDFGDEPFVEDDMAFEEDFGGGDAGFGDPGVGMDDAPAFDDPAVADDVSPSPETAPEDVQAQQAFGEGRDGGGPAWWVWLLVPAFLGGSYLTTTALLAPVTAGATAESGAFTRLLQRTGTTPPARA